MYAIIFNLNYYIIGPLNQWMLHIYLHFIRLKNICIHTISFFMHPNQKTHISLPQREGQRFSDAYCQRIMEQVKHENIACKNNLNHAPGKVDMILELFLDNMTIDFSNQVVMDG